MDSVVTNLLFDMELEGAPVMTQEQTSIDIANIAYEMVIETYHNNRFGQGTEGQEDDGGNAYNEYSELDIDEFELDSENYTDYAHYQSSISTMEEHTDNEDDNENVSEVNNEDDGTGIPLIFTEMFVYEHRIWDYLRANCGWKEINGRGLDNKLYIHPLYFDLRPSEIIRFIEQPTLLEHPVIYFTSLQQLEDYVDYVIHVVRVV